MYVPYDKYTEQGSNKCLVHICSTLRFNSWDPGSILARDGSRDILKNPGISWFAFLLIKMCIHLILPIDTHV